MAALPIGSGVSNVDRLEGETLPWMPIFLSTTPDEADHRSRSDPVAFEVVPLSIFSDIHTLLFGTIIIHIVLRRLSRFGGRCGRGDAVCA